ncbi:MAG: helix-turn-helix transcriptional regulator [Erysipelotrichaceae bacterium]|nr:helix-turn-helix transcriptional regulator [Erysipelotrichaceae bacterium]
MDQIRIGKFIAQLRKEQGLTQKQLAEKFSVSDRAVSKWENGKCLPDIQIIKELCELFGISFNEFISGERLDEQHYTEKLEDNLSSVVQENNRLNSRAVKGKKLLWVLGAAVAVMLLVIYQFYLSRQMNLDKQQRIKIAYGQVSSYNRYDESSLDLVVFLNQGMSIDRFLINDETVIEQKLRNVLLSREPHVGLRITAIYTNGELKEAKKKGEPYIYRAIAVEPWSDTLPYEP